MFEGKINAALQLLSKDDRGGILRTNDEIDIDVTGQTAVLDISLAKPVTQDSLPEGNAIPPEVPPVIFDQITAGTIGRAALNTKGAAGPSGLDAHGWRRLCTSFISASHDPAMHTQPWQNGCVPPSSTQTASPH